MSVSVKPGATALTVIWRSPKSQATVRVRVLSGVSADTAAGARHERRLTAESRHCFDLLPFDA
jgi:hypothetical protein